MWKPVTAPRILAACALVLGARSAGAQGVGADTLATSPNVLLLVDTSGSMEWTSAGDVDPVCVPDTPNTPLSQPNDKSRWIDLLEVMTGTIENYSCYAQPRNIASGFDAEYSFGTIHPFDYGYIADYHRPLSNGCTPGAGDADWFDATPYEFQGVGKKAINFRPFAGGAVDRTSTCNTFRQPLNDGLLDSFDGLIRFGLMTFDTNPGAGTGIGPGNTSDFPSGVSGTWSYISSETKCMNPDTTTQACRGAPKDCTLGTFEVGARNGIAPPWEGRMVSFGPSVDDGRQRNGWIQQVMLATRPVGATPIAGMLSDARDFFWYDTTVDPLAPTTTLSPYAADDSRHDQEVANGCRENFIVLLTDGRPNTDLRPECVDADDSNCPYEKSTGIVAELVKPKTTGQPIVRTYVVGFATGTAKDGATTIDCATMSTSDRTRICAAPADESTAACCELAEIAFEGATKDDQDADCTADNCPAHAFFPKNAAALRTSLSRVFSRTLNKSVSRGYPVTATAGATGDNKGFEFTTGGLIRSSGVWAGVLERRRITCDGDTPVVQKPDANRMDDFVANVNRHPESRNLFTVLSDTDHSAYSIRPYLPTGTNDGVGDDKGLLVPFEPTSLTNESLRLSLASSWCTPGTEATCRKNLVEWAAGDPNAAITRCKSTDFASCSIVGDIFHSVPQIRSGRPTDLLRDETHSAFAAGLNERDTMLYTSSNDGFFHAFLVAPGKAADKKVDSPENFNNELWALVPPAVLPDLQTMYPDSANPGAMNRIPALDGVPVIKDVVATRTSTACTDLNCYPFRLERSKTLLSSEASTWRTIMVQAFGPERPGYFAVDITEPRLDPAHKEVGPKFLWQLTTDEAGNPLFGKGSSTPLITTLSMGPNDNEQVEVPVAILPGGRGDSPSGGNCSAGERLKIDGVDGGPDESSAFRTDVRCYASPGSVAARSLTVVRLDTGEIIRTFRPKGEPLAVSFPTARVATQTKDADGQDVDLDIPAPIMGQPVAYPAQTGQIADRVFVGDAEGRIWRLDVSSIDPAKWEMNVFYDAYWQQSPSTRLPVAQPIQTPPIISVDDKGQLTVAFATGDQDHLIQDPSLTNYIVSATEVLDLAGAVSAGDSARRYHVRLNWSQTLEKGELVLGPMVLFDRTLYFSRFLQARVPGCTSIGDSVIYGVDYLEPAELTDRSKGPVDTFLAQGLALSARTYVNALVPGVGLRQLPSCAVTNAPANSDDEFLGYGKRSTTGASAPGKFQLTLQLSGATPEGASGGASTIKTIDIPTPDLPVRIDSWAPIIE